MRDLGDSARAALVLVGVTEERVTRWLGRPCGCQERAEKLNRLGHWVRRVLAGKTERAADYLDEMVEAL